MKNKKVLKLSASGYASRMCRVCGGGRWRQMKVNCKRGEKNKERGAERVGAGLSLSVQF